MGEQREVAFYTLMLPSLFPWSAIRYKHVCTDLNGDDERVAMAGLASLRHFHSHSAMNDRHDGGDDLMNCSFSQR